MCSMLSLYQLEPRGLQKCACVGVKVHVHVHVALQQKSNFQEEVHHVLYMYSIHVHVIAFRCSCFAFLVPMTEFTCTCTCYTYIVHVPSCHGFKSCPRQLSVFFSLSAFGLCLTLSCLPLHIHVQDLIMYVYMN